MHEKRTISPWVAMILNLYLEVGYVTPNAYIRIVQNLEELNARNAEGTRVTPRSDTPTWMPDEATG